MLLWTRSGAVHRWRELGCLPRLLTGLPLERVVAEITEHEEVTDYDQIRLALAPLRAAGLRLAVDETGAGYASMRHVLALVPALIKLAISLVSNIHTDPARRALAAALTTFATATGTRRGHRDGRGTGVSTRCRCPPQTGITPGAAGLSRGRHLLTVAEQVWASTSQPFDRALAARMRRRGRRDRRW